MTPLTYEGTLREIVTDAGVLRYHEAGPNESGPPLLLLHGSGPGVTGCSCMGSRRHLGHLRRAVLPVVASIEGRT
jgi:hypothetical protein